VELVQSLGFPAEICKWIASFLSDRAVHLCFNNFTSDDIKIELGTPQGSPLSPILSSIYTSPLLHLMKTWDDTTLLMYINDGDIFARAPLYQALATRLVAFYSRCHNWCRQAGLTIEPEKTEIFFFSRKAPTQISMVHAQTQSSCQTGTTSPITQLSHWITSDILDSTSIIDYHGTNTSWWSPPG
jgi:hypothetical protein